eukprot:3962217-Amphidinium_carterae.1
MEAIFWLPPDLALRTTTSAVPHLAGQSNLLRKSICGCSLGEIVRVATPRGYRLFHLARAVESLSVYLVHEEFLSSLGEFTRAKVQELYTQEIELTCVDEQH